MGGGTIHIYIYIPIHRTVAKQMLLHVEMHVIVVAIIMIAIVVMMIITILL